MGYAIGAIVLVLCVGYLYVGYQIGKLLAES